MMTIDTLPDSLHMASPACISCKLYVWCTMGTAQGVDVASEIMLLFSVHYRLTLGCRKYTRGSCARAKPESGTDN